jgi:hypothetical protein
MCLIMQTIGMTFSLEPACTCIVHDGFVLSPLPSRKQLWEACTEEQWLAEKARDSGTTSVYGLMVGGLMVKVDECRSVLDGKAMMMDVERWKESSANWQEWCAGMDGLGGLVVLFASLPL